ncbi:hydroxyethylthiazole kinase [Legionella tucsonensis]|uniref:Hydroxyethylthiazole kinase n=1 Tax=Legionella tucsonensis TaxID=40335 RepID=A0A0W0ZVF7_9GAMM|nr:hydroxyethylthiazole kinase [Legionella tucsonensis]KTD72873.1 hydroxyethylthiazole kinase [Legionella tucsonensis]
MFDWIQFSLTLLKQQKPLIRCLTKNITIDSIANSLLALGVASFIAHQKVKAPSSIKQVFIDNLYIHDWEFFSHVIQGVSQHAL